MSQYEVVTSPGYQFPVGHVFESDALHPSMKQHVRLLRGKKHPATESDDDGPAPSDLVGELYVHDESEAFDLAAAEYAKRVKPVDDAPPAKPATAKVVKAPVAKVPTDGPGENS